MPLETNFQVVSSGLIIVASSGVQRRKESRPPATELGSDYNLILSSGVELTPVPPPESLLLIQPFTSFAPPRYLSTPTWLFL